VKPALLHRTQVFPGTKSGPESPAGFATLKTLQVSPDVRQAGVAVFGRPSGKESLILKVKVRHVAACFAVVTALLQW
jgi:Exoribonuclease Xrn1 D1 domain